ncbi:Rv1355c family protein [Dyadobacter sandarakinus]|uniref:Rv1355c family protein n=1 Tax=Dyadobacter sandarakinus TaxID=2747268 RepID=A0ABX7I4J6_9BACT|nr:Rv1355c family protein [Dyadobacter sandarakinus]QRR01014.1 Rv1355c family protein [Dyadobacter sandarakinus]
MNQESEISKVFKPTVISKELYKNAADFETIFREYQGAVVLDFLESQKKELFKIRNPAARLTASQLDEIYQSWAAGKHVELEGTWVYYPWSNRMLHILDEHEFTELRTSRNQYKITPAEQAALAGKTIGIIGLSVGNAVALSIATERVCGRLKLADFDTIELSNLNRIKTGIHNIGINKCVVTAREIAEIDPYLHIECFTEGITSDNIHDFLLGNARLDILVDECDDLEVKILCRQVAKSLSVPVVMETSDRGMVDVERFDLDPSRPILHGILNNIPEEKLRNIAPADRFSLVLKIIDAPNTSRRGRLSLLEVGQSIGTWPQLASAVTLGGGVVGDVCRRILLGHFSASGRYYVDLEQIVGDPVPAPAFDPVNPHPAFDLQKAVRIADSLSVNRGVTLPEDTLRQIVEAGCGAHPGGTEKAWKWVFRNGYLMLFHDRRQSFSFANHQDIAAMLAFGAACENIGSTGKKLGYEAITQLFPYHEAPELVAAIRFQEMDRTVNPESGTTEIAENTSEQAILNALKAELENDGKVQVGLLNDPGTITKVAEIVSECELVTQLNPWGHHDFFRRGNSPAGQPGAPAAKASPVRQMALGMLRDHKVADTMRSIGGGKLLVQTRTAELAGDGSIAVISVNEPGREGAFRAGAAAQKLTGALARYGLSAEPLLSPTYLFARLETGDGLDQQEIQRLLPLENTYKQIIVSDAKPSDTFLFKIAKTESSEAKINHLPLDEVLFLVNEEI